MKNFFISALALGVALSAAAEMPRIPKGEKPVFKLSQEAQSNALKSRSGATEVKRAKLNVSNLPERTVGWGGTLITEVDKLGTTRTVLEEDFSLLTMGSEEKPDRYTKLKLEGPSDPDDPGFIKPWQNFNPIYTHTPLWGVDAMDGAVVAGAGGCLYLEAALEDDRYLLQAHVNTPMLKLDEDGGTAVVEFRARTNSDEPYNYLYVESGETNNMGPSWDDTDDPITVTGITKEWTTYRLVFRNCGPTTIFNFVLMGPGNIYIDDIKVSQLKPYLELPVALPHTDYKGTSFTANWGAVKGADKYLLNLWYMETIPATEPMMPDTQERRDVFTDREVTGTSTELTGLVSGETYYYSVRAVGGDKTSLESFPWRVYDLEVPVMQPTVTNTVASYTAKWSEVPGAGVYNYWAYDDRVAQADGLFTVTDEDFNGVLLADGTPSGLTKEDPGEECYDSYYSREIKQQGWVGTNAIPYDDYICLDAWYYYQNGSSSGYSSPEMDFSKDGGKFTLTVDLAGQLGTVYYQDGTSAQVYTQAAAALFNWNEEKGDYEQVEIKELTNEVKGDFATFTFNFTKGSKRSIVGVFAIGSYYNLYLDNLKITQNYKKGESLFEPFLYHNFHGARQDENPNEITVVVPAHAQGFDIYHKVSAYSHQADQYNQSYDARESDFSPLEFVMKSQVGVDEIMGSEAAGKAYVEGNTLCVLNPEGLEVNVCTAQGISLFSGKDAELRLPLADGGIYLVRIGTRTLKVAK